MKKFILPIVWLLLLIGWLSTTAFMSDPCTTEVWANLRWIDTDKLRSKCINQVNERQSANNIVHTEYLKNQAIAETARKNIAKSCEVDKIALWEYPENCSWYVDQDLAYEAAIITDIQEELNQPSVPQQAPDQVQPKLDQASPLSNLITNEVDWIDY